MIDGRRVVVTGIGAVTPLGASVAATLAALQAGRSAIAPATTFDASGFACADAAEVLDWDPRPSFRTPKALKLTDRPARFAVAAGKMALSDASWPAGEASRAALGVVIGTSGSDLQARDIGRALARDVPDAPADEIGGFARRILGGLNPLWLLVSLPNMISAHVAIQQEARGPNSTIMSDWAAGHQAIGEAADWIRAGEADAVLAGGADSGVQPFAFAAYQQAGWLTEAGGNSARFVPGEGAAVFLLEERAHALARGARVLAELRAYSAHGGAAAADTLADSLSEAIAAAGWSASDVSRCVVATPEIAAFAVPASRAVQRVLGPCPPPAFSEPRLGHALSAAGPIETALRMAAAPAGTRWLASSVGCSGETVTLAFEQGPVT